MRWLDHPCPNCGERDTMVATVDCAVHDSSILDIIAECHEDSGGCGTVFNTFVSFDDMTVIPRE